jgi:hypothetical protein
LNEGLGPGPLTQQDASLISQKDAAELQLQQLLAQMAQAQQGREQSANSAGQQFQQAAQAPMPQVNPMAALIQSLGGNVASILGETPRYANNAQADLNAQKDELLARRAQNLAALKDNYDRQAAAAQSAGDLLAEAKLRKSADAVSKAYLAIHDEQANKQAMTELNAKEAGLNRRNKEDNDAAMQRARVAARGGGGGSMTATPEIEAQAESIFRGIASGYMDPDITKYGTNRSPLRGVLQRLVADNRLDVVTLMQNFAGNRRAISTQNSPQQTRMRQASETIEPLLGQLEGVVDPKTGKKTGGLVARLGNSKVPMFNAGSQGWAQFIGSQRSGIIKNFLVNARKLATEQAVLMVNGNDPPVTLIEALYKNFSVVESPNAIRGALDGVRNTVQFYRNSIAETGPVTPGSPYSAEPGAPGNPLGGPQLNLGNNPPAGAVRPTAAPPSSTSVPEAATVPMWSKGGKRVMIPPSKVNDFIKNYGGSRTRPK